MDKRLINLCKCLIGSKDYISAEQLCEQLNIKSRTLREDLKQLRETLGNDSGVVLASKSNMGYRFEVVDMEQYEGFVDYIMSMDQYQKDIPESQQERVDYIIRYFLMHDDYIKSDDLADRLFVSKSTFGLDWKKAKAQLAEFNLRIDSKPRIGQKIIGDEADVRACFAHYFFYEENKMRLINQFFSSDFEKNIKGVVKNVLKEFDFHMTDMGYQNLIMHLEIAVFRLKGNKALSGTLINDRIKNSNEWIMAEKIAKGIEALYQVNFCENETSYIAIHLMGRKVYKDQKELLFHPNAIGISTKTMQAVRNKFGIDFNKDIDFLEAFALHLQPMLDRLRFGLKVQNPMLEQVKTQYYRAFEMATEAGNKVCDVLGVMPDENELAYLALHFQLALERMEKTKKSILVVCASGRGTARILIHRVKRRFPDKIERIDSTSYFNLGDVDLSSYDLILSTVPIDVETSVPVIQVNYDLQADDFERIGNKLVLSSEEKENLEQLINRNLFFTQLEFDLMEEIIGFLCNRLVEKEQVPESFNEKVLQREAIASTAIGNYIALPHSAELMVKKTKVAIGLLKQPIDWNGHKVQLVILMCPGSEDSDINIGEMVADLAGNKEAVNRILKNQSYEEFAKYVDSLKDLEGDLSVFK